MYVLVDQGKIKKYPYSIDQLRRDNPQTSFPKNPSEKMLSSWGVYRVEPQDAVDFDYATQNVVHADPVLVGDRWKEAYAVVPASAEEIEQRRQEQASNIRNERNLNLTMSDWTQVADAPVDKEAWAAYRQALRDITKQPGFPWQVEWPAKP